MDVRRAAGNGVPWPDTVSRARPVDRTPAAAADRAGATPTGDAESSLRTATLRRDAPPAASATAPGVQTTAEQLAFQRATFTTPTSLTVTTALAAYAAATATAPPRATSSAGASHGRPSPPRDDDASDAPEPSHYGGLLSALFGGAYSSRA